MEQNSKQILVFRKDLKCRKGKIAAQAGHGYMAFLTKGLTFGGLVFRARPMSETFIQEIQHWLEHSFRKICVSVDSEEALLEVHNKAIAAGLESHLITDNGTTEFNGIPTNTCCAIGPHWDDSFEGITDHLPLY